MVLTLFLAQSGYGRCSSKLVSICNSAEQIVKPGRVHAPTGEQGKQNGGRRGGGKSTNFMTCRSLKYCLATAKKMAMCNDKNCART